MWRYLQYLDPTTREIETMDSKKMNKQLVAGKRPSAVTVAAVQSSDDLFDTQREEMLKMCGFREKPNAAVTYTQSFARKHVESE